MNTTSEVTNLLRQLLLFPSNGVVGLVDDLLKVCREHGLQVEWRPDCCRVRCDKGGWEELTDVQLSKSTFRAILARIATLCNERIPNSASIYGGQGELSCGTDQKRCSELRLPIHHLSRA